MGEQLLARTQRGGQVLHRHGLGRAPESQNPASLANPEFSLAHTRRAGVVPDPALPPCAADGADLVNTFDGQPATLSLGRANCARARVASRGPGRGRAVRFDLPGSEAFGERNARSCSASAARCCAAGRRGHGAGGRRRRAGADARRPRGARRRRARGRRRLAGAGLQPSAGGRAADLRGPRDRVL